MEITRTSLGAALPTNPEKADHMSHDDTKPPWLPPQRAFVVQFYADAGLEATRLAGRVEHVVSGQAGHFDSLETLLAFIRRVLAEGETDA
jgi:hypothetical protein